MGKSSCCKAQKEKLNIKTSVGETAYPNSTSIVSDLKHFQSTFLEHNADLCRLGVETVLDELLQGRRRAVNDLLGIQRK